MNINGRKRRGVGVEVCQEYIATCGFTVLACMILEFSGSFNMKKKEKEWNEIPPSFMDTFGPIALARGSRHYGEARRMSQKCSEPTCAVNIDSPGMRNRTKTTSPSNDIGSQGKKTPRNDAQQHESHLMLRHFSTEGQRPVKTTHAPPPSIKIMRPLPPLDGHRYPHRVLRKSVDWWSCNHRRVDIHACTHAQYIHT